MDVKTYRARSLQEALALVRSDLGNKASVLRTREIRASRWLRWLGAERLIEVTASASVQVPSRLSRRPAAVLAESVSRSRIPPVIAGINLERDEERLTAQEVRGQIRDLQSMVEGLYRQSAARSRPELPAALFRLFTDLLDAEVPEDLARELIERLRAETGSTQLADAALLRNRLADLIMSEVPVAPPIQLSPGRRQLVALVGPTGVGKTTTIAKLAANYRLKQRRRVGLITVDTYRIAAVEQLRTYADIIDLPMEVVSTPQEMRQAMGRLEQLDLILMDTAGRSPKDDLRIQELNSLLVEAAPDEVHLVLSSTSSASSLTQTAERFAAVGTTALVLTKLDEATGLGNVLPLVRASKLPLSYLTHGQNVPDDIEAADASRLAGAVLGINLSRPTTPYQRRRAQPEY
jgi:flagellar biosynthesis protein FlhF